MKAILASRIVMKWLIASVWIVNGLFCKILNLVPRHQQIVAYILGKEYATFFTNLIGIGELLIAIWIISDIKFKWCIIVQIVLVSIMNIIEILIVSHLLLFGKFNIVFAMLFISILYFYGFYLHQKRQ